MRCDEVLPGSRSAAFPGRRNPVPAKNVADGLIREFLSKVGKSAHDPVVTPTRILSRHPDHQFAELASDPRPPGIGEKSRPIKLLRDQSSVPPQNRVRFHHARDLLQRLAAEPNSTAPQHAVPSTTVMRFNAA